MILKDDPFLYAPDDLSVGGGAPAAAPSAPTVPDPQPAAPAPDAAIAPQAPENQWQGVRDALKSSYGLDLSSRFQDDGAALAHLAHTYVQAQRVMPQWQEMLPHLSEFQKWRAEQTKAQQPAPEKWAYKSPSYDPSWESQLVRDPISGQMVPPPHIGQRYYDGRREFTDALHALVKDPLSVVKPGIQEMIREESRQLIQQHLGGFQDNSYAQQVIQQNANWIFERDANGQQVVDPISGGPSLTPQGQFYRSAIDKAQRLGIQNLPAQHEYAMSLLMAARGAQQAAPTPQQQNEQIKQNFLTQNHGTNGGPATPPSQNPSEPPVRGANALARRMRDDLKQAGISDVRQAG